MEGALRLGSLSLLSLPRQKTLSPPPPSSHVRVSSHISLRCRNSDRYVLFPYTRTAARRLTRSTGERPEGSSEEAEGISRHEEKPAEERKEAEPLMVLDKKDGSATDEMLAGVLEEIHMIEWLEFGKVLGTTGVVLSVIIGSSIVLLLGCGLCSSCCCAWNRKSTEGVRVPSNSIISSPSTPSSRRFQIVFLPGRGFRKRPSGREGEAAGEHRKPKMRSMSARSVVNH